MHSLRLTQRWFGKKLFFANTNHNSCYLGLVVKHCVRANLDHHCMYLGSETVLPKMNSTAELYCMPLLSLCA